MPATDSAHARVGRASATGDAASSLINKQPVVPFAAMSSHDPELPKAHAERQPVGGVLLMNTRPRHRGSQVVELGLHLHEPNLQRHAPRFQVFWVSARK